MSELFSFVERLRGGGDWSAAQRARLEKLAERLADSGKNVEAVFGRTDAGDPWCVVKGDDEEVLVHVARVGRTYVVHSVAEGTIEEAADLESLLRERLDAGADAGLERQGDVVLPFELRRAQTLFALAVAAGAFESLSPSDASAAPVETSPGAADLSAPPNHAGLASSLEPIAAEQSPQAAQIEGFAPSSAARSLQPAAAPAGGVSAPPEAAAPAADHAAAPVEPAHADKVAATAQSLTPAATVEVHGTGGDDRLAGTALAEWMKGGAGNDTLIGGGGADTLEGGDGDDWLSFSDGAVVIGGRGADTFQVHAPAHRSPHQLLGVIVDFSPAEGDKVVTSFGKLVNFKPRPASDDGGASTGRSHSGEAAHWTMTRVQVDVDDDGTTDGFLLVVSRLDPLDPADPHAGLQVLGRDPTNVNALLVDVTGDGVADGRLTVDPTGGADLLFVGRSLFSAGQTGAD